jgi:hypothetical protein
MIANGKILLSLAFALLSSSAIAVGFDVTLTKKSIHLLTSDEQPVANVYQVLWVDAEHMSFGLCGERPPYPGFCWHPEHLLKLELGSNTAGLSYIKEERFQKNSKNWDSLEITLSTYGIMVPECKPPLHERFYTIHLANECDSLTIYSEALHRDLTKVSDLSCHFTETKRQIQQRIQQALNTCQH